MARRGTSVVKTGHKRVGAGMYEPKIRVPETIKFKSTDSIVRFDRFVPKNEHRKYDLYIYVYFQASETCGKLGTELPLKEEELINLIEKYFIVVTYAQDNPKGSGK